MRALAVLAGADLVLIVVAFEQQAGSGFWLPTGHIALTLTAVLALSARGREGDWNQLAIPAGAAFGPAAILAFLHWSPWRTPRCNKGAVTRALASERKDHLAAPPSKFGQLARLYDERLTFPASGEVQSLRLLLRSGDLATRRAALETVVRSFEPRLSELIAMSLQDPEQTIRALAAAASAQISQNVVDQLTSVPKANMSTDETYDSAMRLLENGHFNVLLSDATRAECRRRAFEDLKHAREAASGDHHRMVLVEDAIAAVTSPSLTGRSEQGKHMSASR